MIELEECNCNAKPLLSNWPNTCHFLHETEKNTLPTTQAHKIEDERKSLKIVPRSLIGRKRTESVQSCKILSACSCEFFRSIHSKLVSNSGEHSPLRRSVERVRSGARVTLETISLHTGFIDPFYKTNGNREVGALHSSQRRYFKQFYSYFLFQCR